MRRFILSSLFTLCVVVFSFAITKSQVVVYINGEKYYIHTVAPQETIYSISKCYNVDQQVIIDLNSANLKAGENIKIPYEAQQPEKMSAWRTMRTFTKHKVKKGETLYSISRRYEISIETIIEDNPSIDPIAIPTDHTLLIRRKMMGKSSKENNDDEWAGYQSDLNLTTPSEGYKYHIVAKGETIYSLSKQSNMSEDEFIKLNNLEEGLKAGSIIKIPAGSLSQTEEVEDNEEIIEETLPSSNQITLRSLKKGETLRVALLLPLSRNGVPSRQFAEFYRGFEAGLDTIRTRYNHNIELTVYNTERNTNTVKEIVESEEFSNTNLIVGPIYEDLLEPVIEYAEQHHTPLVSPLAAVKEHHSSVLFQLAPPAQSKYNKVEEMVSDKRHVTLIYTEQTDSLFEQNIKELLGERPYDTHKYEYANPTEVAEKMKDDKESAGDLSKYINNGKENTVIVMSSSETDVDRVLSALSSAQINIVARGGKAPKYEVLGNSDWSRYKNIDRTILFKNNVVLLSSYHAKRDNGTVRSFDSNYIKRYNSLPSLYVYRGYDAAVIFGEGCYSDMDYQLMGRTFTPLQSHYRFEVDPQSGTHVNTQWLKVNYKSDYKITIE